MTLTASPFEMLARFQAKAMGYPDLRLLVFPGPLFTCHPEEALAKGEEIAEQVVDLLTDNGENTATAGTLSSTAQ